VTSAPALPESDPVQRVARGAALTGLGAVVAAVGGVALTLVVARSYPPQLAGTFFAATTFFLIVSTLAQLGTDVGLVRYLSAFSTHGLGARRAGVLRIALIPVLVVAVCCAVAMEFAAPAIATVVGSPEVYVATTSMLRWLAPFLPIAAVYGSLLAATRAQGSMRTTVTVDSVYRTLFQPVGVGIAVLAGLPPAVAVIAWVSPYVFGSLWCLVVLARPTSRSVGSKRAGTNADLVDDLEVAPKAAGSVPEESLARQFWSFTAARAVGSAVVMVWRRFDILLVAALSGPADAAVYTAASRFLVVGNLGIQAVTMTVSPQLGKLFARRDIAGAHRVYATATLWTMVFAWPLYLVTAGAAHLVIRVFGAEYSAGTSSVVVLSAAMLVATACGSVDSVLLMSGRSLLSLGNAVITLAANVGLDLVLIPRFGILGAAIGWAGSIALRNLLALVQIRQLMGIGAFGRRMLFVAGLAALCFAAAPAALSFAGRGDAELALSLACGSAVYGGCLWWARRWLDLDTFASALIRRGGISRAEKAPA
jgi:O-antigen/teichoic acid export membrane protein